MATSRTGLANHLHFRRRVLNRDRKAGITHCPECAVLLDYDTSRLPNSAEPDHIIPVARGGTNDVTNGRTICRRCNQSRGANATPKRERRAVEASPGW
jgi:5-methylcytosine-specific restriction endonuclease McrA